MPHNRAMNKCQRADGETADVVEGFVVVHDGNICVLKQGVHAQHQNPLNGDTHHLCRSEDKHTRQMGAVWPTKLRSAATCNICPECWGLVSTRESSKQHCGQIEPN